MKKKNLNKPRKINFPQLMRMAFIDREISSGSYPDLKKLSTEYQVSTKSIARTIDFMKTFYNAPIVYDNRIRGYFYSDKKFKLLQFDFNENDLQSLAFLIKTVKMSGKNPYSKDVDSLFNKIFYIYNDRLSIHIRDLENIFSFRIRNSRSVDNKIFGIIKDALVENRTIDCIYQTGYTGKISRRKLDPYHFVNDKGEWYLIAFCHRDKSIKLFSVSRFKSVNITGPDFVKSDKFSADKYFENSFGIFSGSRKSFKVKISFDRDSARYVREKTWHSSQKIHEKNDGSLILEMKVNSKDEIKHWVLSWGKSCSLLYPKKLANEMREELKSALKNYS
ncbi:MAG: WYL domain-containing protein [Bacteroidetes bacterium]|nr:WYL domain-containing protein [Bacteroidota bacterium]